MGDQQIDVAVAARRHGLSEGAGQTLFNALVAGGGGQAQFSHPELGGMGQWSGGMTQIGDMFNNALKAKVDAFCQDMAPAARSARSGGNAALGQWQSQGDGRHDRGATSGFSPWAVHNADWWPSELGSPSSSGSQNGMSYACFPDKRRLAIVRDGKVTLYDTGEHRLGGFSQQQSSGSDLAFSGQYGPVSLHSMPVVDW